MSEELEQSESKDDTEVSEDEVVKPRFKIKMPGPLVYFFIGPFLLIFVIYIALTKILLTSDLAHEAKLEEVLQSYSKQENSDDDEGGQTEAGAAVPENADEAGFLDTHNYFQFPMAFAVNIPDTKKNLTFELAVSSFQSGVTAEWFFESFNAFVPAIRSDILYFMGAHSLEELQSADFQKKLLNDLRDVINQKLESLGSKPEISKVLFIRFVIT